MTREQAIDKLQDLWNEIYNEDSDGYIYAEALDMAIEALSADTVQGVGRYENAMQKLQEMPRYLNGIKEKQITKISDNYTTKKPNDEVEQKNDVVVESTDLISRADAIKAIESRQTEQWIDADVDYNNGLESAVAEIKALPSADRPSGEWVPCSERLPKEKARVLTYDSMGDVVFGQYDKGRWYWEAEACADYWAKNDGVIAWMPLPEPYKDGDTR